MIQIAFQPPVRSLRRKMSAKIEMKMKISMTQKKKTTIDQTMSQNVSVGPPTELHAVRNRLDAAMTRARPSPAADVERPETGLHGGCPPRVDVGH
jgi:hypothetical protein